MSADLPYAGTSGWSGTDTSEQRAREADESGETSKRQNMVTAAVMAHGHQGLTVAELRDRSGWHHGTASGVLSVLHKVGKLARLEEKRNRCHVYVHPMFVNGRETQTHGRNKPDPVREEQLRIAHYLREQASLRFDSFGPHDSRGAAFWDVYVALLEETL
jgi:hypothetical protein